MELKEAKYILAIAKHKSINKAAKALYISQPSLSKYLQNLEYRLDTRLFDHIHNEYVPTYIGKRYLAYAKQMVEIDSEWNHEYKDYHDLKNGELNIAIPTMRSYYMVPDTISEFHKQFPQIKVNIYEVYSMVENMLDLNENIDALIYSTENVPKSFDYIVLGESEVVLVTTKDHPVYKKAIHKKGFRYKWIDIADLEGEPLICLHHDQTTQTIVDKLFEQKGIKPNIWMHTRSSDVALRMVQMNSGLTFVSEGYAENFHSDGKLVSLSVGDKPIHTYMVAAFRKGQYRPEYLDKYIEICKKILF